MRLVHVFLVALCFQSFVLAEQDQTGSADTDDAKTDSAVAANTTGIIEPGVVEKVLASVRENYRPLRAVKARVRAETISNVAPAAPPNARPNSQDTLEILPAPSMLFEWTAQLSGENQRHDILGPVGRQIISADAAGVTEHEIGPGRATVMPWTTPYITGGMLQFDPREAGFLCMGERLSHILTNAQVMSARFIKRSDDETIAEIRTQSLRPTHSLAIECSSRFNFLPTRVSYIFNHDRRLTSFTNVEYQQVGTDPTPIWFLKSAVRRNSTYLLKNTSPDDKDWGQVTTIAVLDLETDVTPPPPRDDAQSLPAGTG